jgi:mannan endo-1,4-beta-mannosidase
MKMILLLLMVLAGRPVFSQSSFVKRNKEQFTLQGKPYRYIGTNYWYGGLLALQEDPLKGIDRLRKELDFLRSHGITNLRILGGVEGAGMIAGVPRVSPALQVRKGVFDTSVLRGLDVLLHEMGKRNMKAIIFFSNNWEWSGGFLQYLNWNGVISDSVLRSKMEWDAMRDHISKFYTCEPCIDDYKKQVAIILDRENSITHKKYRDDPVIMAWELANEPRPMRPSSNNLYQKWISNIAAFIKSIDQNHLVCLGHEGETGTESIQLFEQVHANQQVDYLTIHIWPKNWGWMNAKTMKADFQKAANLSVAYINRHIAIAKKLSKPLVIEEFGFPRDDMQFNAGTSTHLRDHYYELVFSSLKNRYVAGINFWAFNGIARPSGERVFWKPGDDYMGDPPMEEQSLYGVFDNDTTTWSTIKKGMRLLRSPGKK